MEPAAGSSVANLYTAYRSVCRMSNTFKMAIFKYRALDIRWLRKPRFRKFVVIVSVIFSINVFLVYNLVNSYSDSALQEEDPSGRGRYHLEVSNVRYDLHCVVFIKIKNNFTNSKC